MRFLVDTQIFLWTAIDEPRLGTLADPLGDNANDVFLSAASTWEIAIKYGLGKLNLPEPPLTYVPSRLSAGEIETIDITHSHALAVSDLPPHHRDPFDRLLVAQAEVEGLTIATADPVFNFYTDRVLMPRSTP